MEAEKLDESRSFDEVFGIGAKFKFVQDGKFFNARKMRVTEDGEIFEPEVSVESEEEVSIEDLADAIKEELSDEIEKAVAEAAASGVKLPKRLKKKGA